MFRLTIASLCCWLGALAFVAIAVPISSSVFTELIYNYEASIVFEGSSDQQVSGQIINGGGGGFKIQAQAHLELLYDTSTSGDNNNNLIDDSGGGGPDGSKLAGNQLVRLRLIKPTFFNGDQQLVIKDNKRNHNPEHDLYAHIVTLSNGTAYIRELYTHQADSTTFKNIKKSILLNLLPTSHHNKNYLITNQSQHSTLTKSTSTDDNSIRDSDTCIDDNNLAQPELFSPDSISRVAIVAKLRKQPTNGIESTTVNGRGNSNNNNNNNDLNAKQSTRQTIYQTVEGHQNVTFGSRVFSEGQSNLSTKFQLELIELKNTNYEPFDKANSIAGAMQLIDKQNYQADTIELQRERRICSHHHCGRNLAQLVDDYKEFLHDESMASVEAAVAFLRLLERLRDSQGGTTVKEILSILKRIKGHGGIESSFLDILAGARTKDSIFAALKYIKLAKNKNLDTAERFLSVLSVSAKTASKMQPRRPLKSPYYFTQTPALKRSKLLREQEAHMASLEFIAQELLNTFEQTPKQKWASHKLRWSTLLTLATLVNANNNQQEINQQTGANGDSLNERVSSLLLKELNGCHKDDTDCRIVALQAIGNVGLLGDAQFQALKEHVLHSGKRESTSAMRVLRDLLQNQAKDKPLTQDFYTNLKDFLLRVVYDNSIETTARVLGSEMIVRFLPNSLASLELLNHLPSFNNNELATMIYSRMQSLNPDELAKHNDNWYWKSCIINGTSTSFVRTMARTDSLNASYGVNVELMNKNKVLKESSFDVFLDTKKRTQDLFSLGIFARGLSSFAGGDESEDDSSETTMAGMTLRLLGGYLRPYVFFSGTTELMSHIWSGTASEPTTVFNGDLLLIDHDEGYPLISGFVAEQQMRGVLSIDVTGKIKVSIWHRNSQSVVRTKAAVIVQASQTVPTSFDNFWQAHLFSFGGQALIDFVSDTDFASSPPKICLQVTQPEFMVRFNSRKRDQTMTNEVRRKINRKNYSIGAKSYSLNTENNKMCSLMSDEL